MDKEYKEINDWVNTLEQCVYLLYDYKAKGELVKYNFNGHWIYSDAVTMDGAYIEVTGRNKADFDKFQEEQRQKLLADMEKAEQDAKANIPNWIERGHKLLPEDKWETWDKIVPIRASGLYHGMELDNTLEIQEILTSGDKNSFEKAKQCMENQGHSGMSWSLVCSIIKEFCTFGESFVDYLNRKEN